MADRRTFYQRALEGFEPSGASFEDIGRIARHRARNRRLTAALLALAVSLGSGYLVWSAFRGSVSRPAGSAAGQVLVNVRSPAGNEDVFAMNPDGSGLTPVLTGPTRDSEAVFSPDGSRIAFVRDGDIWVVGIDGTGLQQLTSDPGSDVLTDSSPAWSPDGNRIAYHHGEAGTYGIWIIDANGGTPEQVTNGTYDGSPAWSPDGSHVAYTGALGDRPTNYELFVVNVSDGRIQQVTHDQLYGGGPSWSPDGSRIAFFDGHPYAFDIYTIKPDGTGLTKLTDWRGYDAAPLWSPDGGSLLFQSDRDSEHPATAVESGSTPSSSVYAMNADGSDVTRVLATTNDREFSVSSWSDQVHEAPAALDSTVTSAGTYAFDNVSVIPLDGHTATGQAVLGIVADVHWTGTEPPREQFCTATISASDGTAVARKHMGFFSGQRDFLSDGGALTTFTRGDVLAPPGDDPSRLTASIVCSDP